MKTVKWWIEEALTLKGRADRLGFIYGFTSRKYFDALKPYATLLDKAEKIVVGREE